MLTTGHSGVCLVTVSILPYLSYYYYYFFEYQIIFLWMFKCYILLLRLNLLVFIVTDFNFNQPWLFFFSFSDQWELFSHGRGRGGGTVWTRGVQRLYPALLPTGEVCFVLQSFHTYSSALEINHRQR